MNYEFYFLKDAELEDPEILRVIAPSFDNAAVMVARKFGWTATAENCTRVTEYIGSIDIRPIQIQNLFSRQADAASSSRL